MLVIFKNVRNLELQTWYLFKDVRQWEWLVQINLNNLRMYMFMRDFRNELRNLWCENKYIESLIENKDKEKIKDYELSNQIELSELLSIFDELTWWETGMYILFK